MNKKISSLWGIIVILLLIIIAVSAIYLSRGKEEDIVDEEVGKVTITTNKAEYRQGELVKITVKNSLDSSIWYLDAEIGGWNPWWGVQKMEEGNWVEMQIHKPIDEECLIIVREKVPIEELIKELNASIEKRDTWNLEKCVTISSIGPEIELQFLTLGDYRLSFTYGLNKDKYDKKTVYSNEFKIKPFEDFVEEPNIKELSVGGLKNCILASSWEEYYEKKNLPKWIFEMIPETKSWVEEPIKVPDNLKIALEGAELYRFPLHIAGADIIAEPIVVYKNNYCKLGIDNYAKIFAPIEKENVIDYLILAEKALATNNYGYFGITNIILNKNDYDKLDFLKESDCSPDITQMTEGKKRITEVVKKDNQYTISLISCTAFMAAQCSEITFIVEEDGSIERGVSQRFITCEIGIMF